MEKQGYPSLDWTYFFGHQVVW